MTGESRHVWEHGIPPVTEPRYSITFPLDGGLTMQLQSRGQHRMRNALL